MKKQLKGKRSPERREVFHDDAQKRKKLKPLTKEKYRPGPRNTGSDEDEDLSNLINYFDEDE